MNGLYDPDQEKSSCGVGFLTRKDGTQTDEVIEKLHEALCAVPHRGGMSSEGVGDGAGVNLDLSLRFFSDLTGEQLHLGQFGVGNFFLPNDPTFHAEADGAGADDHALDAGGAEAGDGVGDVMEEVAGDFAVVAHEDVGAELDDEAARWGRGRSRE